MLIEPGSIFAQGTAAFGIRVVWFAQWAAAFGIGVVCSVDCYLWCWRGGPDEARAPPLLSQWLKLPSTVWVVLQLGQLYEHGFGAMQLK